jgi:uncharacterized protein (TIGR03437 family)
MRIMLCFLLAGGSLSAQISSSAYRVLGQTDLTGNGVNMVQGIGLHGPAGVALDNRGGQTHVYVVDTGNNRVLAWPDVSSYQTGDAAALVLGQPSAQSSGPYGIGLKGFYNPTAAAIDPLTGNLYVADTGNNRVVRFPSPFDNPGRIEPDAVYGEPNFQTLKPAAVSSGTLSQPAGVAVDPTGNLWVSDTANHRILRFAASALNSGVPPAADTVIGQKDFSSSSANQGGTVSATGFNSPLGLAFDAQGNLFVADYNNTRVLKFAAPLASGSVNPAAVGVWGEANLVSRGVPTQASGSTIAGPLGVAIDNNGNLYVAVSADNRVLVFSAATSPGASAKNVMGQSDVSTTTANTGTSPYASPNTLSAPADVKVDQNGNVYIADSGNNRIVSIPSGTKSASRVWGQNDFSSNGINQVKPTSINFPYSMAVDYSQSPYALYVSDTNNNRVLVWKDSAHFKSGDPADLVIGQPTLRTAFANVDGGTAQTPTATSLSAPMGIAVDQSSGALYVADSGNNRILRYPRPVAQGGRITPDAVIGQSAFTTANSAAVNASTLNQPAGLATGPNGDLFVADSGNNRVLEFAQGAGNGASAIRVYGQPNMTSSSKPGQVSAQTLAGPQGVSVDQAANLYVADTGASRVLIFPNTRSAPVSGMAAAYVIGQNSFNTTSNTAVLKGPAAVTTDSNGNIYVADYSNSRVAVFTSLIFLPAAGGTPSNVIGQQSLSGTSTNWDSTNGQATADGLYGPVGVYTDRQDTLYVGDAGNNRVLHFLKPAVVVNAATFQTGIPVSPGALATLGGSSLANDTALVSDATWPTTLLNRQILVNDQLASAIYYLDPNQANFQIPSNAPVGTARVCVRTADTAELIAGGTLLTAAAAPGLFTATQNGAGQAAVVNQDGSLNSAAHPAPMGSTITFYGTGQGQVSPAISDGTPAPKLPLSNTVAVPTSDGKTCLNSQPAVCVAIGSGFGSIQYTGLAPGYIGLWQINVTVPQGIVTGAAVPVKVVIDGIQSNLVTIAVR